MKSWPTAIKDYYNELKLEMRRVTWPNRRQVEGTTLVVILTVFGFAAFFAVVDAVLQDSVVRIFNVLSKT
ncbi:MAG TPA: preprotein translocase subunit SecE [Bryobacteraceae bacterium]|nr:preprotein translocase subunit SecE [Bryobacteraceae bacterium]